MTTFTRLAQVGWTLLLIIPLNTALIGDDGLLNLFIYVPFSNGNVSTLCLDQENPCSNLGFSQMAAAQVAIEAFNARATEIVPELAAPEFQNCNIQIDFNRSRVFNTGATSHQAAKSFSAQPEPPSAMVGPYTDIPAQELSVLATAGEIPLTVTRAFNQRVVFDDFSPFTSMITPDLQSSVEVLVEYLLLRERTDFIATVYALTDTGTQRSEAVSLGLSEASIAHELIPFVSPGQVSFQNSTRTVRTALERVKESGFKTIVLALEFFNQEAPLIADMAEELGLANGEHMWIFIGEADPLVLYSNNTNIQKLISGSTWLGAIERHFVDPANPRMLTAWNRQNSTGVDKVNDMNPMKKGEDGQEDEVGYFYAEPDFYQVYGPGLGDGMMFDAIMATAMGACLAERDVGNITSGAAHLKGIRSVGFDGEAGPLVFQNNGASSGARIPASAFWGVFNLLPVVGFRSTITEIYFNKTWIKLLDFYYADGTTSPPALLRDLPEQNYLNKGLRATGLALMGIIMLGAVLAVAWVYKHRAHRVLRAAQPQFLYLIAFGSAVSASTILVISFDESYGWSEQQLSRACMAIPWLLSLGHIITYGALFSKLWRINKVLQFSRRKIDIKQVAWPMAVLVVATIVVLVLWTSLDSLHWSREELDEMTGESIGQCSSKDMAAFLAPLVVLMLIPTVLTGAMAWKTKDIDDAYSEARWIFTMITVQIEVIIVAVPMITVLRQVSIDGRYIGFVFMLWTFPSSALGFIIGPKVTAYYQAIRGNDTTKSKRGALQGTVRISGLPNQQTTEGGAPETLLASSLGGKTTETPANTSTPKHSGTGVEFRSGEPQGPVPGEEPATET